MQGMRTLRMEFFQSRYDDREVPADYTTSSGYTGKEESYRGYGDGQPERRPWTSRTLKVILIILIICVGFPVVIPIVGGAVAGLFWTDCRSLRNLF